MSSLLHSFVGQLLFDLVRGVTLFKHFYISISRLATLIAHTYIGRNRSRPVSVGECAAKRLHLVNSVSNVNSSIVSCKLPPPLTNVPLPELRLSCTINSSVVASFIVQFIGNNRDAGSEIPASLTV